tara:strand:+ start:129 stop:1040 length:912 start_codon:yes stop_codon:yes gene_type:complete
MSLENLKRNKNQIDKLLKAAEAAGGSTSTEQQSYGDDRIWKPTVDKAGNGYAVIRFLPSQEGEDLPWVRYWDHGFKGPTGLWYIENSLTSIGQADPVSEMNSRLWNSGNEEDKVIVRDRKRRLHYVTNIYVVNDSGNPQNEGKVMLYKFGKKIFEKLMDVMQPAFQDETPINPFDLWSGADFKLKIRNLEGYRNYDKSEFAGQSQLFDGDETKLDAVYSQVHALKDFVEPSNYKTYDELKSKLMRVLGEDVDEGPMTLKQEIQMNEPEAAPQPKVQESVTAESITIDDDDETMSYFAKLAAEQ